jgi:hypothetical protein
MPSGKIQTANHAKHANTNSNALKALRKLAQGWLVAPKSDEGESEPTLGNRPTK